jgi:predicted outer membrane lipoprotein
MKRIFMFIGLMVVALGMIAIAIMLGELGPWYFAWLLGTATIVLVAAAGGAMLDAQDEQRRETTGNGRGRARGGCLVHPPL